MSVPPDRPTEPLRPAPRQPVQPIQPSPPPPIVDERVVSSGVDVSALVLRLEDALSSLRTGLMIVGVIAVAALGVAIYSLVKDDGGGSASGSGAASDARVSQLDDRIDRLSRQVQDARSAARSSNDDAGVGDRVGALEKTVKALADRPQPGDATQAVEELSGRIDDIAQDVEQLKQAQTP